MLSSQHQYLTLQRQYFPHNINALSTISMISPQCQCLLSTTSMHSPHYQFFLHNVKALSTMSMISPQSQCFLPNVNVISITSMLSSQRQYLTLQRQYFLHNVNTFSTTSEFSPQRQFLLHNVNDYPLHQSLSTKSILSSNVNST